MIRQTENGVIIEVRVRPNSRRFSLIEKDGQLILEVTSPPVEGKANLEIVKGLKRVFGKEVEIIRGLKTSRKTILIRNACTEHIEKLINRKV